MSQLAYRRVLLKLSGEALMGDEDYGIDPKVIGRLAREVIEAREAGAEIAVATSTVAARVGFGGHRKTGRDSASVAAATLTPILRTPPVGSPSN